MKRRDFLKETAALGLGIGVAKGAPAAQPPPGKAPAGERIPKGPTPQMSGRMQSEWRWYNFSLRARPYPLARGVHLFADWRYVEPGGLVWRSAKGEPTEMWDEGPYVDAYADQATVPEGIVIRAQPAQIGEPLPPDIMSGKIVLEDGVYRMWYHVSDERSLYLPEMARRDRAEAYKSTRAWRDVVRYAESSDGMDWRMPRLNSIDPSEYARTNGIEFSNVVFAGGKAHDWKNPAVFRDSHGPASERYKMVYGATFGARSGGTRELAMRMFEDFRRKWPHDELEPFTIELLTNMGDLACLMGATSPDGIRWNPIPEPLAIHVTDSDHAVSYDELIGRYVWYSRANWWCSKRRAIARSETLDFRHFPPPEVVVMPDIGEGPAVEWYTPAQTIYPGTTDQYLMFPSQYIRGDEAGIVHLFSSVDGIHWGRVPGEPVVTRGPAGGDRDTWIRSCPDLLPLPRDRVGIMLMSQLKPHKFPRRAGREAQVENRHISFWAYWPKGRLAAVEADGFGSFCTPALQVEGRKLILNLHTKTAGEVRVEVAKPGVGPAPGPVVPGRSFADCDPMHGDQPSQTVTWRGQPDLGIAEGEPVVLRFRMRMAKLFAFEIV